MPRGAVYIGPAPVITGDIQADNGLIREIVAILLPPQPESAAWCDTPVVIEGPGSFVGTNEGQNGENTRGSCGGGKPAVFTMTFDAETPGGEEGCPEQGTGHLLSESARRAESQSPIGHPLDLPIAGA